MASVWRATGGAVGAQQIPAGGLGRSLTPWLDYTWNLEGPGYKSVLSTEKPQETVKEELLHDRDAGSPTGMFSEPVIPFTRSNHPIDMAPTRDPTVATSEPPVTLKSKVAEEEQICYHRGGDWFAEDVEQHMALLPEVVSTIDDATIEDIQAGDPEFNTPEEIDRLRRIIWRRKHLLIGKGNALPPAALGAVCDIDVGGAAPVAQGVRPVAPQFREKLSQLIKGLLSAKIIQPSTSPWVSPIVIIIKTNGVDIRLCIDYRSVNSLIRLMVYPMPLINDLLEDLDKVLWYCSLDMASGFWVVTMTPRAREISAFITPFGLFEWLRMAFGLKNAPQIYQRLVDNALYGHLKISANSDPVLPIDVFNDGEPETDQKPSVLGRRSYIDDILVTASDWDVLCEKVEQLLEACARWNLSISVVKSFWGLRKVDYLGHRESADGLEAHPKDLESLTNLPFPRTLRSMQSFLESLNYYSRFIEDFAIYAAVLYELREADFHKIRVKVEIKTVPDPQLIGDGRSTVLDDGRGERAMIAFTMLKTKIASTPILRHFDPDRAPVVVVYASPGSSPDIGCLLYPPGNEVDQGADSAFDVGVVVTLFRLQCVDRHRPQEIAPPDRGDAVELDEHLLVVSFDGSARVKRGGGAYDAIVSRLPGWEILAAASEYAPDLTVNEAEYRGLLLSFDLLKNLDRGRLIVCGYTNLVIRQMRGEIDCKAPGLQLLRQKALDQLRS
ncbi:unnamed protein product [Phytophthora fragariaefolia]|uniref:Unnamed protein product n=1 Tax=Phytophthora fragariaefolia TaxID=1490495 RepID=A0A9W6WJ70_9STRA|nr:unnamed protein product [Phytophthora fragariaefolia]